MTTNKYDIAVIGGGAAGMMAALFSARMGNARVILIERNEKLGRKIYITGKGRCNVTNAADPDSFMKNIIRNPRFLYSALDKLDNQALMTLLESLGVPLKTERGERVFPASDHASDITRALEHELMRLGVKCAFNSRVKSIAAGFKLDVENRSIIEADRVILATGGLSYPSTGSDGDGHKMAVALNHELIDPYPALTAIETSESWPHILMGLTLKNVTLSAFQGKKKLYSQLGELLFTHFGISGPLALTLSSLVSLPPGGIAIQIDLKPGLSEAQLDQRILRDFAAAPNRQLIRIMDGLEPHNLALVLLEQLGIPPTLPVHSVTQAQRRQIVSLLKALPLTIKSLRGYDEAIITRGGVAVKGINPSTMESKLVPGLYFAGELIDIDALTGGFNLQLAFSTGALAGESARESLEGR